MIITTISSGFGNQLFQYAAGYAAARRACTELRLNVRFYNRNKFRAYQLDRLEITGKPLSMVGQIREKLSRDRSRSFVMEVARRRAGLKGFKTFHETEAHDLGRPFPTGRNATLMGYWQDERYFVDYTADLRREFQFKVPPNEYNRTVIEKIGSQPSVCLHVRRGDYVQPQEILSPCSVRYYEAAIERMNSDVPGAKYFVFSDDLEWAESHLSLPAGSEFVRGNVGVSDIDDLRLMSHCDHFIIANSTFSWWGAWLSPSEDKRVIAPNPWFKVPQPNEAGIVPERWLRMDV